MTLDRGWLASFAALLLLELPGASRQPQATRSDNTVWAVVFYDENENGRLDPAEAVRLPGVKVGIAGRSATSAVATGRARLDGVASGVHEPRLDAATLPPFFVAGPVAPISVPLAGDAPLPVTLPIGRNRPNTYMAFGDSITEGVGSSDDSGYRDALQTRLQKHFGAASVIGEGISGTISHQGARRLPAALERNRPAFTLILYGTNDWDDTDSDPVATINSLRRMLRSVKAAQSLPFLATIPPTCVGADERASPERNAWIVRSNQRIRVLASEEGAVLVDVHAALSREKDLRRLFQDALHPNDAGYLVIAATFFEAIAGSSAP